MEIKDRVKVIQKRTPRIKILIISSLIEEEELEECIKTWDNFITSEDNINVHKGNWNE